jgi:hypothetical protein
VFHWIAGIVHYTIVPIWKSDLRCGVLGIERNASYYGRVDSSYWSKNINHTNKDLSGRENDCGDTVFGGGSSLKSGREAQITASIFINIDEG